ncbi:hypothetical protein N0V93_000502 [Gnomoniopsis smithogilvyi]|uniref:Uncharacterized protein n=1 Tax=Gnomoniopsis smithogilvyi TaxID=1191159 RepID=A0A9W8Z1X2_9PEZI|nr:hypothetical protein N0V93_000502 [Gnomoniopsis smithogilvyi]
MVELHFTPRLSTKVFSPQLVVLTYDRLREAYSCDSMAIFISVAAVAPIIVLAQAPTTDTTTSATTNGTTITASVTTNLIPSTTITATYHNPTCDADYVVDHCLALTTINQENCATNDFACQCTSYQAIETCFDNCPGDPRQHTYAGTIAQYCALAGLPTTNTGLAPTTSASATSTRPRAGSKETSTSEGSTSSPTANTGANLAKCAGGVMVAMAGLAAAVL